jgi:hypothetical protein
LHNAKLTLTNKRIVFWQSFGERVKYALSNQNSGAGNQLIQLYNVLGIHLPQISVEKLILGDSKKEIESERRATEEHRKKLSSKKKEQKQKEIDKDSAYGTQDLIEIQTQQTQKQKFPCLHCSKQFVYHKSLLNHVQKIHDKS